MAEQDQAGRTELLQPRYARRLDKLAEMLRVSAGHLAGGRFKQAEAICRKALDLQPNDPATLRLFGDILQRTGRAKEAVAPFQRALTVSPGYADAHFGLGVAWYRLGDNAAATRCFQRALELQARFLRSHAQSGDNPAGARTSRGSRRRLSGGDPPAAGMGQPP